MELNAVEKREGEGHKTKTYSNYNIKEYLACNYRKATKKPVIKDNKY